MIKLQITKYKDNENYESELEEFNRKTMYSRCIDDRQPQKTKVDNILEVEITQEQFEAIRKSVIEKF